MPLALESICAEALKGDPDRLAIHFNHRWYRWEEVRRVAERLGECLRASNAGQRPKVAFVARNRPSALAAFLGLLANGCTIRMLYPFQSSEALAREIALDPPAVVIADSSDFSEIVKSALSSHGVAGIALTEMNAELLAGHAQSTRRDAAVGESQIILLTSGTTGSPKPFALSYSTVAAHYTGSTSTSSTSTSSTSTSSSSAGNASAGGAALLYFPVSNISGLYTTLPPLVNANPIVLLDRFNLDAWRQFVRDYRPAFFGLPPVGYKMALDAGISKEELSCIKAMGAGAAPLDPDVQRMFEQRYGVPILLSYGATEFGGPVVAMTLTLRHQWGDAKALSVGKPLPGMQMRVVDPESGEPVPSGTEGIIEIVSARIGSDWIRTSDLGLIDDDGFLFLKGRADGAIMRGGFKLVPASIEAALMKNPKIALAAVVGLPDDRLGQVPVAAVVPRGGEMSLTAAEVEAELRGHVLATHIPVAWKFVDELPRTPSMKVDIGAVRRLFAN